MAAVIERNAEEQIVDEVSASVTEPMGFAVPDSRKAVIDIRSITKIYKMGDVEVQALRGVSLTVYEGEFVSIMGPSGSGKSTMLQILAALDQPTSGEYYLDGVNVAKLRDNRLAEIRN